MRDSDLSLSVSVLHESGHMERRAKNYEEKRDESKNINFNVSVVTSQSSIISLGLDCARR